MKRVQKSTPDSLISTSVRLPEFRIEQLDAVADSMGGGINRSNVIRVAVEQYLDRGEGREILATKKGLRVPPRVTGAA